MKIDVECCEADVLLGFNGAERGWLLGMYAIELYAPGTGTLHGLAGSSAAAFNQAMSTGMYHLPDVVIRPRRRGDMSSA